jgi:hypothetical protein
MLSAMAPPACPRCHEAAPVALLSTVEMRGDVAQTWVCRDCVSVFGNADEWRRRMVRKRMTLIHAGIAVAAAAGSFALILRRLLSTSA